MAEETSSLVGILETTVDLKCSTEKFHDMLVGRDHHVSNIFPSYIQGCELHEGEMGQVGAISSGIMFMASQHYISRPKYINFYIKTN